MTPANFPQVNIVFGPPEGMDDSQVMRIPSWHYACAFHVVPRSCAMKKIPAWKMLECPQCGAKPHSPCQDWVEAPKIGGGWVTIGPHYARLKLVKAQRGQSRPGELSESFSSKP